MSGNKYWLALGTAVLVLLGYAVWHEVRLMTGPPPSAPASAAPENPSAPKETNPPDESPATGSGGSVLNG